MIPSHPGTPFADTLRLPPAAACAASHTPTATTTTSSPTRHRKQQISVIGNRQDTHDSSSTVWAPHCHCHTSRSVVGRVALVPALAPVALMLRQPG